MPSGVYKRKSSIHAGIKNPMYGKRVSKETKKKISESLKGRNLSQSTKQKMSNSRIGHKVSKATRLKISEAHQGNKNYNWKGDDVTYSGLHIWVRKNLGTPSICENPLCNHKSNNFQWANISGNYLRILSDWIRLCARCHKLFDSKTLDLSQVISERL